MSPLKFNLYFNFFIIGLFNIHIIDNLIIKQ